MATPSAILSILVSADTTAAETKLTKFDRQLAATNDVAKKGIEARLGGTFNREAFTKYEAALSTASRRANDRAAFKAELGANFNNTAFNKYQRAIDQAKVQTTEAEASTHRFGTTVGGLGSKLKSAAAGIAGVGFGLGLLVNASIKAGIGFQKGMETIHTQAGASQKEVEKLTGAVLELSRSTATGPTELTKGLFHLESQGLRAQKAIDALRIAAEGAKVGNANLEDVTNALGGAVVSGIKGTQDFEKAMGVLNATVGAGDMRMQDLADAFGTGLLGPMKQFGVKLTDISGALAVFGDNNIRGADAGTKLLSTIRIMAAPSDAAAKVLKGIGLNATELADRIRKQGLVSALELLHQKLIETGGTASEQARILAQAFGGRQSTGVQLLLGQLDRLKTKTEEVGGGAGKFGAAWQATQKTLSAQLDQLKANFETFGIIIASAVAPVIPALNKASAAVLGFIDQIHSGQGAGGQFANVMRTVGQVIATAFDVLKTEIRVVIGILMVELNAGKTAFNSLKEAARAVAPVVSTVFAGLKIGVTILAAVFKVQFAIIRDVISLAFKLVKPLVEVFVLPPLKTIASIITGVVIPAFNLLKGAATTLGKLFGSTFGGIKGAVKTAMDFIFGAFSSFLKVVADIAGVKLPFLGKIFGHTSDAINQAADSVDNLKRQLDGLPAKTTSEVDVKINFLSNVTGAISSIASTITGVGAKVAGHAVGGMVTTPGYFAGEEAPMHPEVILATNPAYRNRNLGLWAQAGNMLGVPGFAQGGLANAGAMIGATDPWAASHADSWMAGKAKNWIKGQFPSPSGGGGAPSGAGGPVPAGSARDWLIKALQITNHYSQANLSALYSRMIQESGGSPTAINLWDSNAKAGHPSKGLLQTIDSTFNSYALPGYGNIWNPIANAIAAIRYMYARYGHIVGASGVGYRKGGIHGKVRGFAKGGVALPTSGSILGLPGLPSVGAPTVPSSIQGTITGNRNAIAGLEQSFGAIDQFYSLTAGSSFVDSNTGARNETAIKARLDQLAILIAYRQKIFALWGFVVALTEKLIAANEERVRAFQAVLKSISTKGLKGKALTSAQKHITDAKTAISKYAGAAASARGDLTSAIGDRQSAFISLQGLLGEKLSVAGTVAQAASSAIGTSGGVLDNAPVTDTGTIQALTTLLTQANQRTAVSQAQFGVLSALPFGGSFATGGTVPGPIGAPSVIVAHGGERVGQAGDIHLHFAPGTEWLKDFVQVEIGQAGRSTSRTGRRALPGSTGR